MLYHYSRILAFTAIALLRFSTAAHFNCDNSQGYIWCAVTLNSGNGFTYKGIDDGMDCTHDGGYCAQVVADTDTQWKIEVSNDGGSCVDYCTFNTWCEPGGGPYGCSSSCEKDAC